MIVGFMFYLITFISLCQPRHSPDTKYLRDVGMKSIIAVEIKQKFRNMAEISEIREICRNLEIRQKSGRNLGNTAEIWRNVRNFEIPYGLWARVGPLALVAAWDITDQYGSLTIHYASSITHQNNVHEKK